jgi:cell shape-determining protein MreC
MQMPNRYLCTVLDEMRSCFNSRNFGYLDGLIEEVQTLANRMESKLYDIKDHEQLIKDIRDKKKEIKDLDKEIDKLKLKKEKLEESNDSSDNKKDK